MSKKSFNDIEHIIKGLAAANEPAFEEQAWKKMEALLDKDEDRKRPVFFWLKWLLPFIVILPLGWYILHKADGSGKVNSNTAAIKPAAGEQGGVAVNSATQPASDNFIDNKAMPSGEITEPVTAPQPGSSDATKAVKPVKGIADNKALPSGEITEPITAQQPESSDATKAVNPVTGIKVNNGNSYTKNNPATNEGYVQGRKNRRKSKGKANLTVKQGEMDADDAKSRAVAEKPVAEPVAKELGDIVETPAGKENLQAVKDTLAVKAEVKKPVDSSLVADKLEKPKEKAVKAGKKKGFYFLAAVGAEGSGVKLFSADKITARYGVGVGYQLSSRISVQTGFYASTKKYVAGPTDYKVKPGSYWAIVDMKEIEAGCRVYEIPLMVRYDFLKSAKLGYFAAAGISSFIMKNETYHYYYYRYGMPREAEYSYTGNRHFFSVLRINAGVEKKLYRGFSVNLQPGVSIPLAGVGEGEVKLFSADLMLGIKFTPIRKK